MNILLIKKMKNKIQEIENENIILKFIKEQNSKGIGHFAICLIKNTKKISFKFNFDFMLTNFQNCELLLDLDKNQIQCYTPKNNSSNVLIYLIEQINKDKDIIKNLDFNLFVEKIGSKIISFDMIKYNISNELKFIIQDKISGIEKNIEYINSFFPIIQEIESFLNNSKQIVSNGSQVDNYRTIREFKILQNNIEYIIDKTKRNILEIKNNINYNKPKYTFEIKGNNYIFKSKSDEYIFYLYKKQKLEIILSTNNNPILSISYTNSNYDIYITINNKNDINMQIINKLIIYITDTTSLIASILSKAENSNDNNIELFGVEKGKKYLYLGHFLKDNFTGFGLLITPFFYYKGKFSNSNKSDSNGYILFNDDNHFYQGGILGDELNGKGKYKNKKGVIIEGNFERDEIKGLCKFTFNNGDEFQGEMSGNIKKGEWNYINKNSGRKMKIGFNNETNEPKYFY